jgi:DNA modification methylase
MVKKITEQYSLPIQFESAYSSSPEQIKNLLQENLDFHQHESGYATHQIHSFPAKFPPQLPRKFIENLTLPGEVVLDPMLGSGTTLLEAALTGRRGIGFDIDPLALLITKVKTSSLDADKAYSLGKEVIRRAAAAIAHNKHELENEILLRWEPESKAFIDMWFLQQTQLELYALIREIDRIYDERIKDFLRLVFSAIIITKSGGVSLALDLAHTRPHRAKIVTSKNGAIIFGEENAGKDSPRLRHTTKTLRTTLEEFEKRLRVNLKGLANAPVYDFTPRISMGNAQSIPLSDNSIDLIVTSPPYASNAIDYMRAHKFTLVWLGYPIKQLTQKRNEYIGGESSVDFNFEEMPEFTSKVISTIAQLDAKKGLTLHRYYSEMHRVLKEMFRLLKPGKTAIVVVGTSIMRGSDTETQNCLADIGKEIGFQIPEIGVRTLDRDKRMLPAGERLNLDSKIQQRMHHEYVIGFYKPTSEGQNAI